MFNAISNALTLRIVKVLMTLTFVIQTHVQITSESTWMASCIRP